MNEMEVLLGGPCDGLPTLKTTSPHMYAGRIGDGKINVYLRKEDGRLHFSHTTTASELESGENSPVPEVKKK